MQLRPAQPHDISALALIRTQSWGTESYWEKRIRGYLEVVQHPKGALQKRALFVAEQEGQVVGLVAGHLTQRLGCEGELQWINVSKEFQGRQIASQLLRHMAEWFVAQHAFYICVNVEPDNVKGIRFYQKHDATSLDEYWMVWKDIRTLV